METTAVLSFLGGVLAAAIGVFLKAWFDFEIKKHDRLFSKRESSYQELWNLTALLPLRPRIDVTYEDLAKFSVNLRSWYFNAGGMYLSFESQYALNKLQERVLAAIESRATGKIDISVYDSLQEQCSKLRRELTHDLMSRAKWRLFSSKRSMAQLDELQQARRIKDHQRLDSTG